MITEIPFKSTKEHCTPIIIDIASMDELTGYITFHVTQEDTHVVLHMIRDEVFAIYGLKYLESADWEISIDMIAMSIEINMLKAFLLIQGL